MLNLTPADCRVNDMRTQETVARAERLAALHQDAPMSLRRISLVSRLALALTRPVQALAPRRSPRQGMLATPRS